MDSDDEFDDEIPRDVPGGVPVEATVESECLGACHSGRFVMLATDVDDDLDPSLVDALEFDLTRDHEEVQSIVNGRPRRLVLANSTSVLDASGDARIIPTHIDSGSGGEVVNTNQFDMTAGDTDQDVRRKGERPRRRRLVFL